MSSLLLLASSRGCRMLEELGISHLATTTSKTLMAALSTAGCCLAPGSIWASREAAGQLLCRCLEVSALDLLRSLLDCMEKSQLAMETASLALSRAIKTAFRHTMLHPGLSAPESRGSLRWPVAATGGCSPSVIPGAAA